VAKQLTDVIRERLQAMKDGGTGTKRIAEETGVPYSCLFDFLNGGGLRSDNLDRLARYVGVWDDETGTWTGR
jgi:hypothetical protein